MGIEIDPQNLVPLPGQTCSKSLGRSCLADATFLVGYCNNHLSSLLFCRIVVIYKSIFLFYYIYTFIAIQKAKKGLPFPKEGSPFSIMT